METTKTVRAGTWDEFRAAVGKLFEALAKHSDMSETTCSVLETAAARLSDLGDMSAALTAAYELWLEFSADEARSVSVAYVVSERLAEIAHPFATAEHSGFRVIDSISDRVKLQKAVRTTLCEELEAWDPDALNAMMVAS